MQWQRSPAVALSTVLTAMTLAGCTGHTTTAPSTGPSTSPSASAVASAAPRPGAAKTPAATGTSDPADEPAALARPVVSFARAAGIHPQLLMAILYNESYKPHDAEFQRTWLQMDPEASLGVANMHRAAYDDTRRGRDFAHRPWEDLIDDPALGVEAAAWYLHDLSARLPRHWKSTLTRDELLALGYNTGPGNMLAFARGVPPGAQAQVYLDKLHGNWSVAAEALKRQS